MSAKRPKRDLFNTYMDELLKDIDYPDPSKDPASFIDCLKTQLAEIVARTTPPKKSSKRGKTAKQRHDEDRTV